MNQTMDITGMFGILNISALLLGRVTDQWSSG